MNPKENKRNLWEIVSTREYQKHVTISTIGSTPESAEEIDDKIVYMEDLEKRKQAYGICGECNEPGTGEDWCQPSEWPEGYIDSWDIENQKWKRYSRKAALKSLDNSSCISAEFLNEIKTHLQIYLWDVIQYLITKCWDAKVENRPITKELYQELEKLYYKQSKYRSQINEYEPVNSDVIKTTLHSEYLDCQLDELDLNEINQDEENNIE
ncbi:kinase-like domain-containing protein [Rhizophagus irregularis DAOM 181602=DAOM 197198]|nr:kinase-like domain-containing protein [Rhizophagus irregularis DAOM 181602=DAOM 197198]